MEIMRLFSYMNLYDLSDKTPNLDRFCNDKVFTCAFGRPGVFFNSYNPSFWKKKYKMQRVQEEESHTGYTPPPPYTLVDQHNNNNNNNNINNNNNVNNNNNNQYHSQNPYPATVIPPDADFRLAQKLQDEEYAHWVDTTPQQEYYRSGETSISTHLPRAPMPPIPEHYQYNHYQSYQNEQNQNFQNTGQSQQYPVIYASPNQPPLPYQTSPYASNCAGNGQMCYGSMNQGYYHSSQSHPFYNAPYHNYQQISQREVEEDNSNCLSGFALASLLCYCFSLYDE
ncbi:hypothetical protein GLOIN_2v1735015 [Rhizophagus clarus]|uniref:Uncharacterized protein n=1 Tax=Rhizophagus clarus TaxID=94130 RepID=A0A8H3R3K6_9GLOM|nr:hypothetical protein GLOIN_2v1735015 [Rhizophagus clarus]